MNRTITATDRCDRKLCFELGRYGMTETGKGRSLYSATRLAMHRALAGRKPISVLRYRIGKEVCYVDVVRMPGCSLRIGCCLFTGSDADALRKWALSK